MTDETGNDFRNCQTSRSGKSIVKTGYVVQWQCVPECGGLIDWGGSGSRMDLEVLAWGCCVLGFRAPVVRLTYDKGWQLAYFAISVFLFAL